MSLSYIVQQMRPKEFNRNSVLEKCIVLFWSEGFNGTGIQKIVDLTNVNRYSLYDEYGDKEGILIASLKLYEERHIDWELLSSPLSIGDTLYQFYLSFYNPLKHNNHPLGCYISSMAMELRETDTMQTFFNEYLDRLKHKFSQALNENSSLEAKELETGAQRLTTFYCISMGMYVIFSQEETEKYLRNNLNLIVQCLNR